MSVKAVELMLPAILMDKQMMPMWLTFGFITVVASVLGIMTWIKNAGTLLSNGIRVETKVNLKEFFYAILEDND